MRRLAWLLGLLLAAPLAAQPLSFGLFGDTPYNRWEREQLPQMLAAMGREGLAFAVHAGDIKSGSSVCSDEVYQDILGVFEAAPLPLIYVPGDNEWTDCHRRNNGGHDPLERLDRLRALFFAGEESLGQRRLPLARQSRDPAFVRYRENVRWQMGGALFVGLNVPGSYTSAFQLAREKKLAGVLIVIQANPGLEAAAAGHPKRAYADLIEQLRRETEAYSGQVVLVHGDTHFFQINQPLLDSAGSRVLTNFTRVEVYGYPFMGWVRGTVDASTPEVFRFTPMRWNPPAAGSSP